MKSLTCPVCGAQAVLLIIKEAAEVCAVSTRTIHRWKGKGAIHVFKLPSGRKLVCRVSLLQMMTSSEEAGDSPDQDKRVETKCDKVRQSGTGVLITR